MQDHCVGRRGAIAASYAILIAGTAAQAFSHTAVPLAGWRALTGLGLALGASVVPILTAEISPNHLRGKATPRPN